MSESFVLLLNSVDDFYIIGMVRFSGSMKQLELVSRNPRLEIKI